MAFYTTVLAPIGGGAGDFAVEAAAAPTRNLHVGFWVPGHDLVDAFWHAGVAAGHRSDGEPGPRPQYRDDYYGAFLLDPDGNSIEAVSHGAGPRIQGQVDHLWIRVPDVPAARDRVRGEAEPVGFAISRDDPDRVQFRREDCSLTLVVGEPTARLRVALGGGALEI